MPDTWRLCVCVCVFVRPYTHTRTLIRQRRCVYCTHLCYLLSHLGAVVVSRSAEKNNLVIMQDSYLDENWQLPFEEGADLMPKRKAAPFVPTLSPDSDAKRDWMCLARMTASAVFQFLALTWKHLNTLFYAFYRQKWCRARHQSSSSGENSLMRQPTRTWHLEHRTR